MKFDKSTLLLYAVTDRTWTRQAPLEKQVEEALQGGITFLQLREKSMDKDTFLCEATRIKQLTDAYQVPFVINDNVEVALKCNADGVHIGQNDRSVSYAREMMGENKIIGVSAQTVDQAVRAWKQGADYLGVGAVFPTSTKEDATEVSFEALKDICQAVPIPVVAIGGIQLEKIRQLKHSSIQGIAVVSAIFGSSNIKEATKKLLLEIKDVVND